MGKGKADFKITVKSKGVLALVIFIVLVLAVFALSYASSGTQSVETQSVGMQDGDTQNYSEKAVSEFVGNKATKKIHYPDCRYVSQISEKNIMRFTSLDEADGYSPCAVCNPK